MSVFPIPQLPLRMRADDDDYYYSFIVNGRLTLKRVGLQSCITELNWHGFVFDEPINGQAEMHSSSLIDYAHVRVIQ